MGDAHACQTRITSPYSVGPPKSCCPLIFLACLPTNGVRMRGVKGESTRAQSAVNGFEGSYQFQIVRISKKREWAGKDVVRGRVTLDDNVKPDVSAQSTSTL
ncbi:hypothetical protein PIB30_050703 [Stylosanthes scabra]|uniref:Uncharacterized protein n=1 Tax=Stylosanthes scabra TaxID=79078 RepID=A0ABU6UGF0_9FABA|nr:hypothetical protein [Stylosanthes scabra]